ncbi:MAG TPA: DUF6788 family protein [Egibacteraceae bacterium]|jgi:hypothetical protein|nr:DUF6788 family protein [Egibacteraceae bacterium]
MPTARARRARQRLATTIADLLGNDEAFALPGSITERFTRCGKTTCRCKADPPQLHGPYLQWTRTEHGKTVTRLLDPDQAERYRTWIENTRRLRALLRELEHLGVQVAEHEEGWSR